MPTRSFPTLVAIIALLVLLTACGDDDEPPTGPPPNQAPTVELSVTPTEGPPPLTVSVTLSCSDPDGTVVEHRLDLDGDGAFEIVREAETQTEATYVRDGTARGQCTDDEGAESAVRIQEIAVELGTPDETISLLPRDWTLPEAEVIQFRVERSPEAPDGPVVWSVNGLEGGGAEVGTIDAEGRYTAPDSPPPSRLVQVGAWVEGSAGAFADAAVEVATGLGEPSADETYLDWPSRVTHTASGAPSELRVVLLEGYATSMELDVGGQGDVRQLRPFRSHTWRIRLPRDDVLAGYGEGQLHAFVGFLTATREEHSTGRMNVFRNVADGTVPPATVERLADDVQAGEYVVNIRHDALVVDREVPTEVTQRFYDLFPDNVDFLAIIDQVDLFGNRHYRTVQNPVEGIGRPPLDRAGEWGSDGRLKGFARYPLSVFFDLASPGSVHEIGHEWMVSVDVEPPLRSGAHWTVGSAARGIMGISLPPTGQGGPFPFEVVPVGGDVYELRCVGFAREFNDLELYLMGLLPADSVGPHVVFDDQEIDRSCGTTGTATTVTVDAVIAAHGPRVPAYPDAPTDFRMATIVVSRGRLLTDVEMAFFDHMAARGESRSELLFTEGFVAGMAKPFYLATGERATLTTALEP